jgi:O-antigen/teichoic acid export membrane protein
MWPRARSAASGAWTLFITAARSRSLWTETLQFSWLMADQGVFAATNFIANVLFARWLSPIDYGIFAVSFAGYLLLTVIHFGAILEPILVQSAKVERDRLRSYIRTLILVHILAIGGIAVVSCLAVAVSTALHQSVYGLAILGSMLGGSLMVTLLTARRLCMVFLSVRISATIGIVYMLGVVTTTYLLHRYDCVSWFSLWIVMGGWSLLCSSVIFVMLYRELHGDRPYTLGELWRFQWQYARYGLVAACCSWVRVDGVLLLLAHFAGLEVIAETRAVLNIANPVIQVNLALYTSWLVIFSRSHNWQQLRQTALVYTAVAIVPVAVTFAIATPLVRLLYDGRYANGAWLLPLYLAVIALNGIEGVFACYMKAQRFLRRGYAPQIVGAAISFGLGYLLIPSFNQAGAIYAILASFSFGALFAFALAVSKT